MASLYLALMILLFASSSFAFTADDSLQMTHSKHLASRTSNARRLQAAQLQSKIGTRDIGQAIKHDYELHYIDGKWFGLL